MLIFSTDGNNTKLDFVPDFYELRLDLRKDCFSIPDFFLNKKAIITIRDRAEGGKYIGNIDTKITFLQKILDETNLFIDIELANKDLLLNNISPHQKKRVIISVHDFSPKLKLSANYLLNKSCFFYKFVINNNSISEFFEVYHYLNSLNIDYTLISIGYTSLLSRILYQHLGFKATYFGKKGHQTALNQMTERDVIRYDLINISPKTAIGGIIGSEQILNSLGLSFYNKYFQDNNINAVYLPIVIEKARGDDLKLLVELVKSSSFFCFGFSITMPFKKEIGKWEVNTSPTSAHSLQGGQDINRSYNLWIPNDNKSYLTDEDAFIEAFKKLHITKETKILLLGIGAMAKTVLKLLPENTIYIITRHSLTAFVEWVGEGIFCLINTTPLGTNGEDIREIYPNLKFHKVIDLPYSTEKTKLALYCQENNIPIVDGKQFWKLQAKKQLELFITSCHSKQSEESLGNFTNN